MFLIFNWYRLSFNSEELRIVCIVLTSAERPPMAVQQTGHVIQTETRDKDTALPLVEVLVT